MRRLHAVLAPAAVALVFALVVLAAATPIARAHGRLPATGEIVFSPTDPNLIVVRTTFGLLVSHDAGASFRWICLDVMQARLDEDPSVVVFADGSIGASLFAGLALGSDGGCTWGFPSSDLDGTVVIDLAADPSDPSAAFALTSSGTQPNAVYRTADDGQTWTPTSAPIDPILFETMAVAPSNAQRIYLTGAYPADGTNPRQPYVYRSDDGGQTWQRFAYTLSNPDANIYLLGVDPTDPDRVFAKEWVDVAGGPDGSVLRSDDGGQTFTEVLPMLPNAQGFAASDDGMTVWVSSIENGGLWQSTDGGMTFSEERSDVNLACLTVHDGELWACGNNFSDGFAVGRSADGGSTFEPVLVFDQIEGVIECPDGSDTRVQCDPALADLINDLGLPIDAGLPGGDAGMADGGSGGEGTGGGGCGCSAAGSRTPAGGAFALATLLGLAIVGRRRRRGGRRGPGRLG